MTLRCARGDMFINAAGGTLPAHPGSALAPHPTPLSPPLIDLCHIYGFQLHRCTNKYNLSKWLEKNSDCCDRKNEIKV